MNVAPNVVLWEHGKLPSFVAARGYEVMFENEHVKVTRCENGIGGWNVRIDVKRS